MDLNLIISHYYLNLGGAMEKKTLVENYYRMGLTFNEISEILSRFHGLTISVRQLKRITSSLGLYRRKNQSNILDVGSFIMREIQGSAQLHGYKWMHTKCKENGFVIDHETVRLLLKCLDPEGVRCRTKRRLRRREYSNPGPNYLWHIDGYDKLKPYGICIHGCIDGYSRQIIWLEAASSNNNPRLIAGYFMDAVSKVGGCPKRVRADLGTENGTVRQLQIFLRENDHTCDQNNVFMYGTSRCNQRIESWWGILRKEFTQFWMNVFESFKDDGHFSGDFLAHELIRFCFLEIIQTELNMVAQTWNRHRIRKTKNQRAPNGRPFALYHFPELYGTEDFLWDVDEIRVQLCKEQCIKKAKIPCDEQLYDLCHLVMEDHGWHHPTDTQDAIELYSSLAPIIRDLLI